MADENTKPMLDPAGADEPILKLVDLGTSPGRPVCPVHIVLMKSYSSDKKTGSTYYRCPVDGCTCREKRERGVNQIIPQSPQICPRCNVACEASLEKSNRFFWRLECPNACGFTTNLPKFNSDHSKRRKSPNDIMDV